MIFCSRTTCQLCAKETTCSDVPETEYKAAIAELRSLLAAAIQERDAAIDQWYAARAILLHTQTERDGALGEVARLREERATRWIRY